MEFCRLRISIVVILAVVLAAALHTEAIRSERSAHEQQQLPNNIGIGNNNWYSNLNQPPSADVVMDDLSSDDHDLNYLQKRPNYRPYNDYDADANEELENMPFGVQNVRSALVPVRSTRSRYPAHHSANAAAIVGSPSRITFQSLCPSRRETVFLNLQQSDYEYRPNHYDEVYCTHPYTSHHTYSPQANKVEDSVCGDVGFNCIQLNRTIFLTRKTSGTDCWESETRLIPAGCECMWPKHHFGDIAVHH